LDPGTRRYVDGRVVPGIEKERSAFIFKGQPDQRKLFFFDNMALISVAIYRVTIKEIDTFKVM